MGLCVVLVSAPEGPRLPGSFVHERETLAEAVLRSLAAKAGVAGLAPRQLRVFDDPDRDDRGWVLSVAHTDVVAVTRLALDATKAHLVRTTALPALPWGHELIVDYAVEALRADYRRHPDPFGLIDTPFTLRSLRHLHEVVAGGPLAKDAFARIMHPHLIDTGNKSGGTVGKPARLFTTDKETA